jgi:hypothetical protein
VTGMPTKACLGACFADGVACTKALDCCSTGCKNGKCGGLCTLEGDSCASNAECCSDLCQGGKCQVDLVNRDCRPTGESCTSGSGRGCCNTCNDATSRCAFGSDTCFAQGVTCTADAQCCHGICQNSLCTTPCAADTGVCTTNADCCTFNCVAGKCVPPQPTGAGGSAGAGGAAGTCTPTGQSCTANGQCCTNLCFGGFCDVQVK